MKQFLFFATAPPTGKPTPKPTGKPTPKPTGKPTPKPTGKPTPKPTPKPTQKPTAKPTTPPKIPDCYDGIKNGNETGIDCGGGVCPKCDNGMPCRGDEDCDSNQCEQNVCQSKFYEK
ncbi:unnamed protein product [Rotaria sordida]|uniref:Uncharacterized protein n=1 Tax=Rotaria sordida TaxID=392033 RepID=A0A815KSD7_9BILA|nr:unnamed protein product [Rotaria sordida]CAF1400144.1 unnamed protein product [Rotaria sordida]